MGSSPEVLEAYRRQHRRDFSTFLGSRGEEMVKGGRTVLTFVGGRLGVPSSGIEEYVQFTLLATALVEMVAEGLINEDDLHSFNLPMYPASKEEVGEIVSGEGSFNIEKLEEFVLPWDSHIERGINSNDNLDTYIGSGNLWRISFGLLRSRSWPAAARFGSFIIGEVYERFGKKMGELQSSMESPPFSNLVVSLNKK